MRQAFTRLAALSRSDFVVQYAYLFASLLLLGGLLWLGRAFDWTTFPTAWRLNLQDPVDTAVLWVRDNLFEFEWGHFCWEHGRLATSSSCGCSIRWTLSFRNFSPGLR